MRRAYCPKYPNCLLLQESDTDRRANQDHDIPLEPDNRNAYPIRIRIPQSVQSAADLIRNRRYHRGLLSNGWPLRSPRNLLMTLGFVADSLQPAEHGRRAADAVPDDAEVPHLPREDPPESRHLAAPKPELDHPNEIHQH